MADSAQTAAPTALNPADISALPFDLREKWARAVASAAFVVTAAYTLHAALHMKGGMNMSGNWTMPMMWMRMPGQSLVGAAATFLLMWQAMMIAMMLPSSWPMLELYARVARHAEHKRPLLDTFLVAASYFAVWGAFGCLAFVIGIEISHAAMVSVHTSRWIPGIAGAALILAGVWQLTPLKLSCLKHCREPLLFLGHAYRHGIWGAVRVGLHHGAFCAACCWALMTMQLLLGVMNLAVMIAVAAIIAIEKLWRRGPMLARLVGAVSIGAGLFLFLRSLLGRMPL
jgi:predicted metal-binding membrane protein